MQRRPVLAAMVAGAGLVSLACGPKYAGVKLPPMPRPQYGNCIAYERSVACGDMSLPIPAGRRWLNTQQVYESGIDQNGRPYMKTGKRIVIGKEPSFYQGPR